MSGRGGLVLAVLAVLVFWAYTRDGLPMPTGGIGGGGGEVRGCVVDKPKPVAGFNKQQRRHAATIAQVGINKGVGERGVVVGLATAMQESGLRNLDYGDRDSLGLFQQRPSMGWGTPSQVRDPVYASKKFFSALKRVDGWRSMRVTQAAQAVQRSAFPEAYQQHVPRAERLADALLRRC